MFLYWTCSPVSLFFLYWETKTGPDTLYGVTNTKYRGSWSAGYALANISHYSINIYYCKAALLTGVQPFYPKIFFFFFFLQNISIQWAPDNTAACGYFIPGLGISICFCWTSWISVSPSQLKPHCTATLLLDMLSSSSTFGFIHRLEESVFLSVIQVASEDMKW